MKKLFTILFLFFICKASFGQGYPGKQNIANDSTNVSVGKNSKGAISGGLINISAPDTAGLNLLRIAYYDGAQAYTTNDKNLWIRFNNKWNLIALNGGGGPADTLYWRLGGNNLSLASIDYPFGTNSNDDLNIITNATLRMSIPSTGIAFSDDTTVFKVLTIDPTTKDVGYASWIGSGLAGWGLTGNAGTTEASNFLGTTDNEPLVFKVFNQRSGLIMNETPWNTSFGFESGLQNTTGSINTSFGYGALRNNTAGGSNTAVGLDAQRNATGSENVGMGYGALGNVTNIRNVGLGTSALVNSQDARENTATGNYVMLANRQGDNNTANGSSALRGNADGTNNVAVGIISLTQNTTSISTISVSAGGSGYTTATVTISAPVVAADPNNNSLQATATATLSAGAVIAIVVTEPGKGYSSFSPPTVTITGDGTGATATATLASGDNNTALGSSALALSRIGDNNTAVGYGAASSLLIGSNNLYLGSFNGTGFTNRSNRIFISDGSSNVRIMSDSLGLIGIGTNTPRRKLDVVGGDAFIYELTVGRGAGSDISNTAFGYQAIDTSAGSGFNTAIGWNANKKGGKFITTAVGAQALSRGGGDYDVAVGANSLYQGQSVIGRNTGVGYGTFFNQTSGSNNTAIGFGAAFGMTTGTFNTAIGVESMGKGSNSVGTVGSKGSYNLALGYWSLYMNDSSNNNTAVGPGALYGTTPSIGYNIGLGNNSGFSLVTGNYNMILGSNLGASINGFSRHVLISDGEGNLRMYIDSIGKVGIGGSAPHTSAMLDVASTTKGFLIPRMNTTEMNAIGSPTAGLQIYNTDSSKIFLYTSSWNSIGSGGGGSMIYPGAGIPLSTGSAWGTSYSTTGATGAVPLFNLTGAAAGNLIYWNGTNWVNLGTGTAAQHLTGGTTPSWKDTATGGGGGVTTMAAIGATPNANGATISGSTLNLQPASASFGGVVTTGTQTMAGAKTFSTSVTTPFVDLTAGSSNGIKFGGTVRVFDDGSKIRISPSTGLLQVFTSGGTGYVDIYNSAGSSALSLGSTGVIYRSSGALSLQTSDNVGIGAGVGTSATARLHISAGTATANTAPLKLTSGTNLTTAEAGAMEYDGSNFFLSPSTTRKRIPLFTNATPGNGELLIGNGTDFTKATLSSSGATIAITNGAGSINLEVAGAEATYTPTLTNTTNVAASTAYTTHYKRVGDWVHIWGDISIDATTAGVISELGLSLPVSTALANTYDLAGTAAFEDGTIVQIKGDATNDRAMFRFTPVTATNNRYSFIISFKYFAP